MRQLTRSNRAAHVHRSLGVVGTNIKRKVAKTAEDRERGEGEVFATKKRRNRKKGNGVPRLRKSPPWRGGRRRNGFFASRIHFFQCLEKLDGGAARYAGRCEQQLEKCHKVENRKEKHNQCVAGQPSIANARDTDIGNVVQNSDAGYTQNNEKKDADPRNKNRPWEFG